MHRGEMLDNLDAAEEIRRRGHAPRVCVSGSQGAEQDDRRMEGRSEGEMRGACTIDECRDGGRIAEGVDLPHNAWI